MTKTRSNDVTVPMVFDATAHAHDGLTALRSTPVKVSLSDKMTPAQSAAVTQPLRVIYV